MRIQIISLLIISLYLFSQFRDSEEQIDPRLKLMTSPQNSIFDMSKVSVSHSLSMSYCSSGENSVMINEYIAGIKYKISDPLTLKLNLGMAYTPYSTFSLPCENDADIYLKSASLDYKPNDAFRMRIDFRSIRPGDYYFQSDPFGNFNYLKEEE
ncbi:MAG: hypothetical protein KKD38_09190 [Candidatus Delongbacteria bacterium]|nr:hypothetical protein [Candidatus Delongbacteria bacterium]MCG2761025.1 hypothetical protein [Candidatus Delongbacteria bacterium]